MSPWARLAAACALAALAGCQTTGDPREGGLFGWSESKARERQTEKRANVTGAESELTRETARGESLQTRRETTEQSLTAADTNRRRNLELLRIQKAELVAKTEKLEAESPTAATASRARSYRLKVVTIADNIRQSPQVRGEQLRALEEKIDEALARVR